VIIDTPQGLVRVLCSGPLAAVEGKTSVEKALTCVGIEVQKATAAAAVTVAIAHLLLLATNAILVAVDATAVRRSYNFFSDVKVGILLHLGWTV